MARISISMNPALIAKDEEFNDNTHQALMEWSKDVLEQFLSSSSTASWKSHKKNIAGFFIRGFIDYAYRYRLVKPFQYDALLVENMCLHILPKKMSTETKDFKQLASILFTFFGWCESKGILKRSKAIRKKLKKIENNISEVAKIPANWELTKSLFSDFFN